MGLRILGFGLRVVGFGLRTVYDSGVGTEGFESRVFFTSGFKHGSSTQGLRKLVKGPGSRLFGLTAFALNMNKPNLCFLTPELTLKPGFWSFKLFGT